MLFRSGQMSTVALKAVAWYLSRRREKASAASASTRDVHLDDTAADGKVVATSGPENDGEVLDTKKVTVF